MTLWTVASQAPLSIGFFRQEYLSRLLLPSPGDLPDSGIEPGSCIESVESYPWDDQGILPEAHVVYSEHSLLFLGLHTSFLVFPVDEME